MSTVTKVYKNVRGIRTAIKDVARLRDISTILARHGFGAFVTALKLAEVAGVNKIADNFNYDADKYSVAERIRLSIEELGPTFIKLGQILSTRPDLIPADIIEQLQHLQDDVPPMGWEDVEYQVETQLEGKIEDLFKTFSKEPLACASIAQVHRATLLDDTEVVVKVMRRNIDDKIDSDLNILHFLAHQSEQLIPELQLVAPVGIIREFDKALRQELDFTVEEQNILRFTRNFESFEDLLLLKFASCPGNDPSVTYLVCLFLSENINSFVLSPGLLEEIRSLNFDALSTFLLSTSNITSPSLSPALSAGESSTTFAIRAPAAFFKPSDSIILESTFIILTPKKPLSTEPIVIKSSITLFA